MKEPEEKEEPEVGCHSTLKRYVPTSIMAEESCESLAITFFDEPSSSSSSATVSVVLDVGKVDPVAEETVKEEEEEDQFCGITEVMSSVFALDSLYSESLYSTSKIGGVLKEGAFAMTLRLITNVF
jgi:hypothetical protein